MDGDAHSGVNAGLHWFRLGTEFTIQIPLTNYNLLIGANGYFGSLGARLTWQNGRFQLGGSYGVGRSFSVGFAERSDK